MVLKPGLDRTVRLEKPRTAYFCGSFSLKNRSTEKNRDLCKLQSNLTVLRIVNGSCGSHRSLKKKKFKALNATISQYILDSGWLMDTNQYKITHKMLLSLPSCQSYFLPPFISNSLYANDEVITFGGERRHQ